MQNQTETIPACDLGVVLFTSDRIQNLQAQLAEQLAEALDAAKTDQTLTTSATVLALNAALTRVNCTHAALTNEHAKSQATIAAIRQNEARAIAAQNDAQTAAQTEDILA